ncbi:MAG: hypothetical protein UY85_C0005G0017 [Candidatus Peribacteria bacterium GW2011_GWB1_54_5]|nr:MAG: hypothetical protein UY85_C0005G0017 [Candidatus Peribacteria bacterium GW2011_GWB1_54_5]
MCYVIPELMGRPDSIDIGEARPRDFQLLTKGPLVPKQSQRLIQNAVCLENAPRSVTDPCERIPLV